MAEPARRMPRIVLRAWREDPEDLAFLFDTYARPEVRRYIGGGRVMTDAAEARALVERWHALADGVLGVRALTDLGGRPLGSILLKRIPWSSDAPHAGDPEDLEIGWHLHPSAWGHGYAAEGGRAVLAEAWRAGIERVVAVTHPDNAASQHVCRAIGMTGRGRTRAYYDTACELFDIRAS